ncbi:MAG: hypothetical protein KIS62_00825 [Ramlibacter sp.]|nr:hypothetical protein [Ramlibacter sp.]
MRMIFGVLGLLMVVLIVGVLAKKQLGAVSAPPVVPGAAAVPAPAPGATPQQQVDQYKKAVEGALQQARPMPDDK